MCELCSVEPEEREAAEKAALVMAQRLADLAHRYRALSDRSLKPHTDRAVGIKAIALGLVRDLVVEWM